MTLRRCRLRADRVCISLSLLVRSKAGEEKKDTPQKKATRRRPSPLLQRALPKQERDRRGRHGSACQRTRSISFLVAFLFSSKEYLQRCLYQIYICGYLHLSSFPYLSSNSNGYTFFAGTPAVGCPLLAFQLSFSLFASFLDLSVRG